MRASRAVQMQVHSFVMVMGVISGFVFTYVVFGVMRAVITAVVMTVMVFPKFMVVMAVLRQIRVDVVVMLVSLVMGVEQIFGGVVVVVVVIVVVMVGQVALMVMIKKSGVIGDGRITVCTGDEDLNRGAFFPGLNLKADFGEVRRGNPDYRASCFVDNRFRIAGAGQPVKLAVVQNKIGGTSRG